MHRSALPWVLAACSVLPACERLGAAWDGFTGKQPAVEPVVKTYSPRLLRASTPGASFELGAQLRTTRKEDLRGRLELQVAAIQCSAVGTVKEVDGKGRPTRVHYAVRSLSFDFGSGPRQVRDLSVEHRPRDSTVAGLGLPLDAEPARALSLVLAADPATGTGRDELFGTAQARPIPGEWEADPLVLTGWLADRGMSLREASARLQLVAVEDCGEVTCFVARESRGGSLEQLNGEAVKDGNLRNSTAWRLPEAPSLRSRHRKEIEHAQYTRTTEKGDLRVTSDLTRVHTVVFSGENVDFGSHGAIAPTEVALQAPEPDGSCAPPYSQHGQVCVHPTASSLAPEVLAEWIRRFRGGQRSPLVSDLLAAQQKAAQRSP